MPTLVPKAAARCLFTELPSLSALEDGADGQDGFRRRQPQAHRLLAPAQGLVQDWEAERGGSGHMISGMACLSNHHIKGWVRPAMPGLFGPSPNRSVIRLLTHP